MDKKRISNFFIPQHEMIRKANTDGETSVKLNFLSEKKQKLTFLCEDSEISLGKDEFSKAS